MNESPTMTVGDTQEEIAALVRTLHKTHQRLQELAGGELDAVVHPEGHSYLLHEAQEKLRRSEAMQRDFAATQSSILNALPAHIALLDHDGAILSVNEGWRHFAESNGLQNAATGVGQNYLEVCDRARGNRAAEAHEAATGIRAILTGAISKFAIEYPCHSPTEQRWFRLRVNPLENGGRRGAVIMHMDITANKQAQLQIAEQAALIDESRDAILVIDLGHRITFWSKGAERLYGWTDDEARGKIMRELLRMDTSEFQEADRAVRENGAWNGEVEKSTRDGKVLTVDGRWTLIRDAQGQPHSILSINTDITELKKIELQFLRAQRMESIGTLAGGIAHNLNNSLAPITLSLELLKAKFPDPQSQKLLELVSTSAKRSADMVRQVLSFARGVEGERQEVQLPHIVRDVEKIVNDTFLKHIEVRTSVPNDLGTVLGDATQLHQVLLNLCVNARDAMPQGGKLTITAKNVTLDDHEVGLDPEAHPGVYVVVEVEDSGTGIPKAILEKIFDPFFTTKEIGKGTGLGLSTSLAIVKSHGGFVRVNSEPGKGTMFKVYLPSARVMPAIGAAERVVDDLPRGHGELILVIDDEPSVRLITQEILEAFGYRVVLAADGAEGVATYANRGSEISAVITDMRMPIMDGPATIQALRKLSATLPIIVASGFFASDSASKFASLGVKHFLPKPYQVNTLLKVLRETLNPGSETQDPKVPELGHQSH